MKLRPMAAWLAATLMCAVLAGLPVLGRGWNDQKKSATSTAARNKATRLNNLGIAYMEQQRTAEALKLFEEAYAVDHADYTPRLNQGIALLNLEHIEAARKVLMEAGEKEPKNPRVWYNLGLLEKSAGNSDAAATDFGRVAEIDTSDSDAQYFLGLARADLRQYPEAIAAFGRAVALNPFHVSAEFGLAQAFQRSGDENQAKVHLERFQHLNAEKLGKPMSLVYGEQGKYSLAEPMSEALSPVPAPISVHFVDATSALGLQSEAISTSAMPDADRVASPGSGICIFDYDGDGLDDIFLGDATGTGQPALLKNPGKGKFKDVSAAAGLNSLVTVTGCAAGDYDNVSRADLAVATGARVALFHNQGDGTFRDVSDAAGIPAITEARGLTFVDYDHDGDLDLYVTRPGNASAPTGSATANLLLRNNGNGTFTEWTKEAGLAGPPAGLGVAVSDINNDRAIDFVLTSAIEPPAIFLNPREGKFNQIRPWPAGGVAPGPGVIAFDFNKDGWMDLAFTHNTSPAVTLWRNVEGKSYLAAGLPKLDWTRAWGITALDYDNDGWIDFAAVGEDATGGKIALFRNEGPAGFRDVTKDVGLDKIQLQNPRAIVAFDYDGDGATDLLITQVDRQPVLLRNIGGNRNNWLQLALKGEHDNKSAIGTKVEVYAGALQQKFEVAGSSGYLGQGPQSVHAGVGAHHEAEIVRILWPTGVLQDEVHVAANGLRQFTELDRRGSSCPIVFVWNGSRYEFLADMIGPGIVGHWTAPGEHDTPDPNEYFKVSGSQVALRDSRISFRMLEPMEELDYLDQVRLLAVDHPAGIEVTPNEYFASNPPFPKFKVIASRDAHAPAGAWDDRGRDVLPLLLKRDRVYVQDFPDAPYQGFAATHTLELDLGPWDASRPLRLLLDGFTDYFSANSMYAAWQAGIQPMAPYLDALNASGKWVRVMDDMGFPAGLAREMVADLTGKLPAGTRRIRMVTNLKIYWDRIRVDNSPADLPTRITEIPLADVTLQFRGYPQVIEGNPKNDIYYIYENVSQTGPYTRQAGNYTRYGDVKELVTKSDDKYVIYGSGDEVAANFDASGLPPLPAGWTRDYFFYADGFAKDMDFYSAYGDTVSPLPFHTIVPFPYPAGTVYPLDADHLGYILEYNTRPVAGPAGASYQFRYPQ